MRALHAVSGAALVCLDMKVFQPLVGALTPEALLALGETLERPSVGWNLNVVCNSLQQSKSGNSERTSKP